jgi:GAF domain-containing protein
MLDHVPAIQARLVDALFAITTRLVDEADSASVLMQITGSSIDLLDAAAAGIILADPRGGFAVLTASDEGARFVELLQKQESEGPCVDTIRTGKIVEASDLTVESQRWPQFSRFATAAGYRSILSVPMILHGRPIGGLNILYTESVTFSDYQRRLGSVLAALATVHLSQEDGEHRTARAVEETLSLLNERVHVEHAIGMVAGALGVPVAAARAGLERYAQTQALGVGEVARRVTTGQLDPSTLVIENV